MINEEVDAAVMINPALTHGYYEQKLFTEELFIYSTELDDNDGTVHLKNIDFDQILLHEDLRELLLRQIQNPELDSTLKLKKK